MERLRLIDDSPIFFDISYIPNINLPRITARQFENRSLFNILREHYNIEIRGGEQRIKAITPPARIRKHLKLVKDQPVLHLERKIETSTNGLFLYSSIFCNTGKYSIFGRF
jgi:GntR family transcriptional regulator/GntR family frlABCD operon transcriptional regulator